MIDPTTYTRRLHEHCHRCEWWAHRCRKGHVATSPQGCPVHKFPPVEAAGYAPDQPPLPLVEAVPCGTCGSAAAPEPMPDLSWHQVLAHFAQSMLEWVAKGLPLVDTQTHAERFNQCKPCPHYKGFWCQKCKCICYTKTKLATEQCPDNPPRWRRAV